MMSEDKIKMHQRIITNIKKSSEHEGEIRERNTRDLSILVVKTSTKKLKQFVTETTTELRKTPGNILGFFIVIHFLGNMLFMNAIIKAFFGHNLKKVKYCNEGIKISHPYILNERIIDYLFFIEEKIIDLFRKSIRFKYMMNQRTTFYSLHPKS